MIVAWYHYCYNYTIINIHSSIKLQRTAIKIASHLLIQQPDTRAAVHYIHILRQENLQQSIHFQSEISGLEAEMYRLLPFERASAWQNDHTRQNPGAENPRQHHAIIMYGSSRSKAVLICRIYIPCYGRLLQALLAKTHLPAFELFRQLARYLI